MADSTASTASASTSSVGSITLSTSITSNEQTGACTVAKKKEQTGACTVAKKKEQTGDKKEKTEELARKSYIICGYRFHGKDYLTSQLVSSDQKSPFEWLILRAPHIDPKWDEIWSVCELPPTNSSCNLFRLASADALKREVIEMLLESGEVVIPEENKSNLLAYADQLKTFPEQIREGQTFRDILIDVAMKKRDQDPIYWIKLAYQSFRNEHADESFVVSDWRFPNELEYLQDQGENMVTIRVYQPAKERVDTVSETSLDDVATDYVLIYDSFVMEELGHYWSGSAFLQKDDDGIIPLQNVESSDDFASAMFTMQTMSKRLKERLVAVFPQYEDYEFVNI